MTLLDRPDLDRPGPDGAGADGIGSAGADRARLTVTGIVQGVGFRPFVARLAAELGVAGRVWNSSTAVFIDAIADELVLAEFARRISADAPPLARVDTVERSETGVVGVERSETGLVVDGRFTIVESGVDAGARSIVPPDAAVCDDCLTELHDSTDRRFGHPFITCTNCGPRLTIIRDLPYDRPSTTLAEFEMCSACRAEYSDPLDRRYHAQPIGCHDCGPRLWLRSGGCDAEDGAPADLIRRVVDVLAGGGIVAVKSLGGYQLMCRSDDATAVAELRRRKHRPDKPFAVMVPDVDAARSIAIVDDLAAATLVSPAAPIVLLRSTGGPVAADVAPNNPLCGVMLPSTPVHHLIFVEWHQRVGSVPLVVTSANASGAPICHRDDEVDSVVIPLADVVLGHDRPIHVACDDSVVRVIAGDTVPLRRARGLAPVPIAVLRQDAGAGAGEVCVLAVGGELKNTVCLLADGRAHLSPHVGDLENLETLRGFEQHVADLVKFHRVEPGVVVADQHPDYLGTRWAQRGHGDRLVLVQHHHAHVAAVMAEHQLPPDQPVLGMAFDGTGYGSDGTMWGGEFIVADASGFDRVAHLAPFRLPGGDLAVRAPWRIALALLARAGVEWSHDLAPVGAATTAELGLLRRQLDRRLACPATSSVGRLFDGVASLLGLRHEVTFEAHAAIELEVAAERATSSIELAPLTIADDGSIDHTELLRSIVTALRSGAEVDSVAAGFHDALVDVMVDIALRHRRRTHDDLVVLSGGVFQNARLVRSSRAALSIAGFDVRTHRLAPPNDGGLALGQAWIAAHSRSHLSSNHNRQES